MAWYASHSSDVLKSLVFIAFNKNQNRSSKITTAVASSHQKKKSHGKRTNERAKKIANFNFNEMQECWLRFEMIICNHQLLLWHDGCDEIRRNVLDFQLSFFGLYLKTTWNKFEARVPQTRHKIFGRCFVFTSNEMKYFSFCL